VGVAELTEHLGVNHNTVRQHLAKLCRAGLVVEEVEARDRPGRPRLVYRVDGVAAEPWGAPGPYERLALLLTEVVRSGRSPREVGRVAGRREATPARSGADAIDALERDAARQGFEPARRARRGRVELVLQKCPYETAATADPKTVCQLHLGWAEGLAERAGNVAVEGLVVEDPHAAGCRLRLQATNRDGEIEAS
jgi:predicted ArsR family transcriptional regulator